MPSNFATDTTNSGLSILSSHSNFAFLCFHRISYQNSHKELTETSSSYGDRATKSKPTQCKLQSNNAYLQLVYRSDGTLDSKHLRNRDTPTHTCRRELVRQLHPIPVADCRTSTSNQQPEAPPPASYVAGASCRECTCTCMTEYFHAVDVSQLAFCTKG